MNALRLFGLLLSRKRRKVSIVDAMISAAGTWGGTSNLARSATRLSIEAQTQKSVVLLPFPLTCAAHQVTTYPFLFVLFSHVGSQRGYSTSTVSQPPSQGFVPGAPHAPSHPHNPPPCSAHPADTYSKLHTLARPHIHFQNAARKFVKKFKERHHELRQSLMTETGG